MRLWRWLRSKLSAKKLAEDAAIAAAKVAVEEIGKATAMKGQWE